MSILFFAMIQNPKRAEKRMTAVNRHEEEFMNDVLKAIIQCNVFQPALFSANTKFKTPAASSSSENSKINVVISIQKITVSAVIQKLAFECTMATTHKALCQMYGKQDATHSTARKKFIKEHVVEQKSECDTNEMFLHSKSSRNDKSNLSWSNELLTDMETIHLQSLSCITKIEANGTILCKFNKSGYKCLTDEGTHSKQESRQGAERLGNVHQFEMQMHTFRFIPEIKILKNAPTDEKYQGWEDSIVKDTNHVNSTRSLLLHDTSNTLQVDDFTLTSDKYYTEGSLSEATFVETWKEYFGGSTWLALMKVSQKKPVPKSSSTHDSTTSCDRFKNYKAMSGTIFWVIPLLLFLIVSLALSSVVKIPTFSLGKLEQEMRIPETTFLLRDSDSSFLQKITNRVETDSELFGVERKTFGTNKQPIAFISTKNTKQIMTTTIASMPKFEEFHEKTFLPHSLQNSQQETLSQFDESEKFESKSEALKDDGNLKSRRIEVHRKLIFDTFVLKYQCHF
jgi:hypothetical protein